MELGGGHQEPPGRQVAVGAAETQGCQERPRCQQLRHPFPRKSDCEDTQLSLRPWGVGEGQPLLAPAALEGCGQMESPGPDLAVPHPCSTSGCGAAQSRLRVPL